MQTRASACYISSAAQSRTFRSLLAASRFGNCSNLSWSILAQRQPGKLSNAQIRASPALYAPENGKVNFSNAAQPVQEGPTPPAAQTEDYSKAAIKVIFCLDRGEQRCGKRPKIVRATLFFDVYST